MPEEINRIVTGHLSTYLFVPSENSISNLRREGLAAEKIFNIGDVMYDCCIEFSHDKYLNFDIYSKYKIKRKEYIVCTIHRAENTDNIDLLINLIDNLNKLSEVKKIIFCT